MIIAIGAVVAVVALYCLVAAFNASNRIDALRSTVFYGVVISKTYYPAPAECGFFSFCQTEHWVLHIKGTNFHGDTVDQDKSVSRASYDDARVGGEWLYITQIPEAQSIARELGVSVTDRNFQVAFYQTSDCFASVILPITTTFRANQCVIDATRRINSGTYFTEADKAKAVHMIPTIARYIHDNPKA